ncbi:MAG: hypothetical protein IID61_06715 [SAR324 cluster bacterium]|nr:hypothetical protein [SAR324 cluster bacterium]
MPASQSRSIASASARLAASLGGAPHILGPGEHPVRPDQIDPAAKAVCRRLRDNGFSALIVGGAVRDMLLGRNPKDFDIVTSARPPEVKLLFQHARIIGRRFRLVLLRYQGLEVEVSTFRARPARQGRSSLLIRRDNMYGSPREDAFRRDFTVNALGFDPDSLSVVDYVGGLDDLARRNIRTISPPEVSFAEDPVRMLRAVRFKARLGFDLDPALVTALRRMAGDLRHAVRHRLAEETQRFLSCGHAVRVFGEFDRNGLLKPLLALQEHRRYFTRGALKDPLPLLGPYLEELDRWTSREGEPIPPTVALLGLLASLARSELVAYLRGDRLPVPLKRAVMADLRLEAPVMLGEWGLLKGQIVPALQILAAARKLLWEHRRGVEAFSASRPGIREAWTLIILLRNILELEDAYVERGLAAMPDLPVLPILDHHRPRKRTTGNSTGLHDGARKRRKRRRRRRGRRSTPDQE